MMFFTRIQIIYQMMVILRLHKIGGWIIDFGGKYFLEISEFIKPLDDKFEPFSISNF